MPPGAQNAIMGDENYGTDLPVTQTETLDQSVVNMGRFSKTIEFKSLREKIESRIEYYRSYQPGGNGVDVALRDMSNEERGWRSLASDLIISEFRAIIQAYELAAEEVKNEASKQKRT